MIGSDKLFVAFHEWAWSLRTQGFSVFAILQDGKVVEIGKTQKRPCVYKLPENTIALIREYTSNSGRRTIFIYTIPDLQEFRVGDSNNWDTSGIPRVVKMVLDNIIQRYLITEP